MTDLINSVEHVEGESLDVEQSSIRSDPIQLRYLHEDVIADVSIEDTNRNNRDCQKDVSDEKATEERENVQRVQKTFQKRRYVYS